MRLYIPFDAPRKYVTVQFEVDLPANSVVEVPDDVGRFLLRRLHPTGVREIPAGAEIVSTIHEEGKGKKRTSTLKDQIVTESEAAHSAHLLRLHDHSPPSETVREMPSPERAEVKAALRKRGIMPGEAKPE